MFTGIVSGIGQISRVVAAGDSADLLFDIETPWSDVASILLGASIACAGCCLTVIATTGTAFTVQVSRETLSRTLLGRWKVGSRLNLERALKMGDELGGHIVSGHVDGLATLTNKTEEGGSLRLLFDAPPELARFVAEKGSVTLDGVSLTVNHVEGRSFGVNIIPHTAVMTTLGLLKPGDAAHIEIDMLARYVARLQEA